MHGQEDGAKDNDHEDNKPLTGDEKTMEEGPAGKRHCTDFLCVLLLIACWVCMTAVGFAVIGWYDSPDLPKGNPYRLTNAVDWNGELCGFGKNVKGKMLAVYMLSGEAVCVKKCPSKTDYTTFICQNDVGQDGVTDATLAAYDRTNEAENLAYIVQGFKGLAASECIFELESTAYLGYCIPSAAVDMAEAQAAGVADEHLGNITAAAGYEAEKDSGSVWESFCSDLFKAAPTIFGFGFGVALVASFVYIWLLRLPAVLTLIIWGLLTAIQVFLLAIAGLCYSTSVTWGDEDPQIHEDYQVKAMLYLSYFMLAVAGLWFCVVFCVLRKRIMLAIAVVKEAGKAISAQQLLVLFPIIQLAGLACFVAPWTVYCLFLASSGEIESITATYTYGGQTMTSSYKQYTFSNNQRYAGLYLLFSWFWTSEFVIAMGQLVVALAVSTWYFTRDRDSKIGNSNVIWSIKTGFRYHMGSCAFGALIIAIIKTIRAIVAYLQKKAKKSGNKIAQIVLCLIQCCMWCVEKTMKFINKNAYIQTAIFGYSFCKSARRAFFLIARNILRIAAVSIVSSFVLLIGKILVPLGTTTLAYMYLSASGDADQLTGLWAPLLFIFLLSFFTINMFNEVFGMAIWTILQCFVADEEMFGKSGHMFCPGHLKDCISTTQKKAMQAAGAAQVAPDASPAPAPEELP